MAAPDKPGTKPGLNNKVARRIGKSGAVLIKYLGLLRFYNEASLLLKMCGEKARKGV